MSEPIFLYDDSEQTMTRFVGFAGDHGRYDLMIMTTGHFFGKTIVMNLQTGKAAIVNREETEDVDYLASAFNVSIAEAQELSDFLSNSL